MGWTVVAAFAFGIYGSLLDPIVGLIGFVTPIVINVVRRKDREARNKVELEQKMQTEEDARQRQALELVFLENKLRGRLNEKMSAVTSAFQCKAKTSPMGMRDYQRFDREIIRFLETEITETDMNAMQKCGTSLPKIYYQSISGELYENLERKQKDQAASAATRIIYSPLDFERHCANLFRSCGWHVVETPVTGDQGVDLIASQGCDVLAVQCKLYGKPVGNSAVQEVVAGRMHYGANAAVVVATNGYTSGAQALAASNGVRLISPEEIKLFYGVSSTSPSKMKTGRHLDWPPKKSTLK